MGDCRSSMTTEKIFDKVPLLLPSRDADVRDVVSRDAVAYNNKHFPLKQNININKDLSYNIAHCEIHTNKQGMTLV